MSYQINGVLSKIPRIQGDHGNFLYSSTEKLRVKGIALQREVAKMYNSMEEKEKKDRLDICTLNKENYSLKSKLDELKDQDEVDRELSLIDESLLSVSEPSTPGLSTQESTLDLSTQESTPGSSTQESTPGPSAQESTPGPSTQESTPGPIAQN
jgi:molybdopterin converting factor small subunit